MASMWKRRVTALRFLLAILVAYLPLQSLSAQSCCHDEVVAEHADEASTDGHVDDSHEASDCCSCCDTHGTCSNGQSCASSACSHATQFLPASMLDARVLPGVHPSIAPPGLHSDSPPYLETKPPKYLVA